MPDAWRTGLPAAAAEVASPALLIAGLDGRCINLNQGWKTITRSDGCPQTPEGWMDFVHAEDRERLHDAWVRAVCSRGSFSLQVRLRWSSPPDWMELSGTPMAAGDGGIAGFAMMLQEAAAPERSEAELLHSRKMEAVGRLASGLAHDFANLLTMISGYSEIILGRLGAHDALRPEVDEIRKAAQRGSGLTSQLLAFSRWQAVEPKVLDLNTLVADMQKMLRRMIGEHIDIGLYPGPALGHVKADPGQLEQVIMNLAINARDAMPRGGRITIRTANADLDATHERVGLGLDAGPYVMLEIGDNGEGMDAETLGHLFEPFFTTKEKGKGTGLGLATVYGIVKQGRGDVAVRSERGKGTTFTIYLPRVEANHQPAAEQTAARPAVNGNETILLVEDEDGVRRLLSHVLAKRGYTVLEAANGPEACALHQQPGRSVHLLLTDVVMPGMNGRELADRLLQLQPDLKVIFMSGYTDEVLVGIGGHAGAMFLQKPLRPEVLAASVRSMLDGAAGEPDQAVNYVQSGV